MEELTQELLDEIVRRLVDALHPVGIYLFGSHAGGEPNKDSDVDLLVVVNETGLSNRQLARRGRKSLWGLCIPVDVVVCTVGQMEKWSQVSCNLYHTVAEEGRLVYERRERTGGELARQG